MGMELARAAHREAMRDLEAPVEHRMPGMAKPPACRNPDPGALFTRVSRAVRQAITLETRLAAGTLQTPCGPGHFCKPHPPQAADNSRRTAPDAATPRNTPRIGHAYERLDDECAVRDTRAIPQILAAIAQVLGEAPHPPPPRIGPGSASPAPDLPAPPPPAILSRSSAQKHRPPPKPG